MYKLTFAAFALAFASTAYGQSDQSPTRAEVKAETRALEKSGKLIPAGEGGGLGTLKNFKSTKTRDQRKSETLQAARRHELQPPGAAGQWKYDQALRAQPTTRSRPERKAETRLAEKERRLIPAGEGPDAPKR